MNQLPLSDQLPYEFHNPRLNPFCLWFGKRLMASMLRGPHRVQTLAFEGEDRLRELVKRGDGVLLTPNHTDHADSQVMFALSHRIALPFYYMAAYQIFQGKEKWFLPRVGVFPVDREGADLTSFKTGIDILSRGANPLVIFPEGEIYHLGDHVTPLREGAIALAATAANKLAKQGKRLHVVPVGIKYQYLDPEATTRELHALMDELERRLTWWPRSDRSLVERIYEYAEAMIGLKEYEYFREMKSGALPDRIKSLREHLLCTIETRRGIDSNDRRKGVALGVPERVKAIRKSCLDALARPETTPAEAIGLRRDLHDVFVAIQLYSYPGNYVRTSPTVERLAETLMKFEEDFLGVHVVEPRGDRRALIKLGEPIDLTQRLTEYPKLRTAIAALTTELEARMQGLLDTIEPSASSCAIASQLS